VSKKDFELIAEVLRTEAKSWPIDHPHQSHFAVLRLAFIEALKETNPRFNVRSLPDCCTA